MNPIVYALNPDFRSAYKRILFTTMSKGPCRFFWPENNPRYGGYGSPRDQHNASPLTIPGDTEDSDSPTTRASMSVPASQTPQRRQPTPTRNYGTGTPAVPPPPPPPPSPPPPSQTGPVMIAASQQIKMSQLNGLYSSDRTPDKSLSSVTDNASWNTRVRWWHGASFVRSLGSPQCGVVVAFFCLSSSPLFSPLLLPFSFLFSNLLTKK